MLSAFPHKFLPHNPMPMNTSASPAPPDAAPAKTLADAAYRRLRADLIAGRLAPSARLRSNELQARYGLGLSPLREALLRLASEGFVVAEGQRGFTVAPVSLAELADLTRTRQQIEAVALTASIARGDADWEAAILAAYHRLAREPMPSDPANAEAALGWELKHRAFHDALIAACDSPWLLRFHAQLVDHAERYLRARLFNTGARKPAAAAAPRAGGDEHRAIMNAVLARDGAKAVSLMNAHIDRTARFAAQWLQAGTESATARAHATRRRIADTAA